MSVSNPINDTLSASELGMYIAHTVLMGYFFTALISTCNFCTKLHLLKTLIEGQWPCIMYFWWYLYKLDSNSWFWRADPNSSQLNVLLLLAEIWAMLNKFSLSDALIMSSCMWNVKLYIYIYILKCSDSGAQHVTDRYKKELNIMPRR